MYCIEHLSQVIQYKMFLLWQLTCLFMSTINFEAVDLTLLPSFTKGQMGQSLHFDIPGIVLLGLFWGEAGIFDLTILSLMLGGLFV